MLGLFRRTSLAAQLGLVTFVCLIGTCSAALHLIERRTADLMVDPQITTLLRVQVVAALALIATAALLLILALVRRAAKPVEELRLAMAHATAGRFDAPIPTMPTRDLQALRDTFEHLRGQIQQSKHTADDAQMMLARRAHTVDRLLEFSQAIQGAGQSHQVYTALAHFLHQQLSLSGLVIFTHEPETLPPIQVRAATPEGVLDPEHPLADMDVSLCPCLRQNMSKHYTHESPIRCAVERSLTLPATHPAFCIPFHVGRTTAGVVHMALPPGAAWDDERKRLAETYVNSAVSALIALHLLEAAERQSLTDSLTGLYNRHSMDKLVAREVALAERHEHAMSLVMIDMDHFKSINDAHGHAAGDHMLRAFADCVRMTLRKTDLAFRYGGDEFVIVLPQTPLSQAQQVVQKLRQAFAAVDFSHAISHLDRQPTLSIGVAERSRATNILTMQALLAAADQALYDAKNNNRNCVRTYQAPKAA